MKIAEDNRKLMLEIVENNKKLMSEMFENQKLVSTLVSKTVGESTPSINVEGKSAIGPSNGSWYPGEDYS